MAATNLGEVFAKRTFEDSGINSLSATRLFRVKTDGPEVLGSEIVAAIGIVRGSPYPGAPSLRCASCSVRCVGDKGDLWEVEFGYSNEAAASDPDVGVADPVQRRVRVIPSYVAYDHVIEATVDNPPKPIRNSAGSPFADPIVEQRFYRRLTLIRNERDIPAIERYVGKLNSKTFLGYPPGSVKFALFEPGELTFEGDYAYSPCSYVLDIKPGATRDVSPWDKELLDAGTYQLDSSDNLVPIVDENGARVTEPRNLDGEGKVLEDQHDQVFLVFAVCERIDLNDLNLRIN